MHIRYRPDSIEAKSLETEYCPHTFPCIFTGNRNFGRIDRGNPRSTTFHAGSQSSSSVTIAQCISYTLGRCPNENCCSWRENFGFKNPSGISLRCVAGIFGCPVNPRSTIETGSLRTDSIAYGCNDGNNAATVLRQVHRRHSGNPFHIHPTTSFGCQSRQTLIAESLATDSKRMYFTLIAM